MYQLSSISNTSYAKMSQRAENEFAVEVSLLFLLHLMKHCNAKSVACIASAVRQLS